MRRPLASSPVAKRRSAMHPPRWFFLTSLLIAVPLHAQHPWSGSVEASASLLQGNTNQRTLNTQGDLTHADSTFEIKSSLRFGYSDAAHDSLPRQVDRRTWIGALALDYRPHDVVSPFVFATYESSYEKRVLDRLGLGIGGRVVVFKTAATTINISLAILAERMRPTSLSPDTSVISSARWSGRVRLRHKFDSHLNVSHTTFYQPRVTRSASYTVNSNSELSYAVRQSLSLTISYLALFDSDAGSRGARSNNDAQVLFGLKAGF
jgi:hypothetical protein